MANMKSLSGGKAGAGITGGAGIPVHVTNAGSLGGLSAGKTPNGMPAGTPLDEGTPLNNAFKNIGGAKGAMKIGGGAAVSAAFFSASQIMYDMNMSYQKTSAYWSMLRKLEAGIDREYSAVYAAVENLRVALSAFLPSRSLSVEAARHFPAPLPLLYIAQYLGCDEEKLRELNSIADSFIVMGDVVYVEDYCNKRYARQGAFVAAYKNPQIA